MLFNSISFLFFLPLTFILYWVIGSNRLKLQNLLLLFSSYYFYSCWDFRFLFLLIFSTVLDFYSGIKISESQNSRTRKFWFWLSICFNLGFLGIFKYYNFFSESFSELLSNFGLTISIGTFSIILPVGISFYTFHGLSYIIDIYNSKIKAEKNPVDYAVFVSFFPLLVAGPIERATHLLPQIQRKRIFKYSQAVDGLRQILWGFFKKLVIADQASVYADEIFNNMNELNSSSLLLGAIFFSFQIYCDFSGYSDIALGTARLFGIELLRNFNFPYFSRDIAEFWRKWHISLTTWFRDYLYIPLGGSKSGTFTKIRNTFIIFIVSGFWHGANWTFIVWGLINAFYFLPLLILKLNRNNIEMVAKGRMLPKLEELIRMLFTFALTTFAWIFFRSPNLTFAFKYIENMFSISVFQFPNFTGVKNSFTTIVLILFFIIIEWIGREEKYALEKLGYKWTRLQRWLFYFLILLIISLFMQTEETPFIYFQF